MWKNFKVIDADAHMHEPQYLWERYVEPEYRDRVPKVAFMDGNFMVYEPDGKFIPKGEIQAAPRESARRAMEEKYGEAYRQWWSPQIRLKDMDRFGWDIQVLLPTGNNGNFAYRVALKMSNWALPCAALITIGAMITAVSIPSASNLSPYCRARMSERW